MTDMPDRYAVIGHPVEHSRSPEIHAAFARQTGQRLSYDRLPAAPDAFVAVARGFFEAGGAGLNVTLPFKGDAAAFADRLTERAVRAGAVNTLARRDDGLLLGDNTDGAGLLNDLSARVGLSIAGARILILGAGGAVRGVVPVLMGQSPTRLQIANRSPDKAERIARDFADLGSIQACSLAEVGPGWDLIINAISAGLGGEMPALPTHLLDGAGRAYDMLYANGPTPFMQWVGQHSDIPCSDGFGMLVEQAAESFFVWRGVRPDTAPVIQSLRPGAGPASTRDR
ncbi:shikimate dehydrogenase [Salinisphaera sp. T31B1]|uniref:shikimate dehydrogenase n=1 Tax=Salinisphaera sp. T31B1 TaxID=727963 RepID=UPI003341FD71